MRQSGVYAIVNTHNGKCYVGSAIHIARRWKYHRWALRAGKSTHIKLQHAWNKYSGNGFEYVILELIENATPELLSRREQYYLDTLQPAYNICPTANSMFGFTVLEETKARIGSKNKGHPVSEEQREQLRQANLGKKKTLEARERLKATLNRPEVKAKMSKPRSKRVSPQGRENIRQAQLIAQNRPEVKEHQRQVQRGKKIPHEAVERSRQKRIGQKRTLEQRERMSQSRLRWYAEQRRLKNGINNNG